MLNRIVIAGTIALACVGPSIAQEVAIPSEVVAQCNANVDGYDEMPDCLKGGAIGYLMIEAAAREDLYGTMAREVATACARRNDTFYQQWICLENAAEKAVEIRAMIGADQMTDRCYRALSDPDTYARLATEARELRRRVVGEGYWSGISSYYAFKGCREKAEKEPEQEQDASTSFSPRLCRAYGEIERGLNARSPAELRAIFETLEDLPEADRLPSLAQHGLSPETVDTLKTAMADEAGPGIAVLLLGLLRAAHPELSDEILSRHSSDASPLAENAAAGMAELLLDRAVTTYRTECATE